MGFEKRVCILYCTLLLCISLMCIRLYSLSSAENNRSMSVLEGQYTAKMNIAERSGFVYDRNMRLLSHERDGAVIAVNPASFGDIKKTSSLLGALSQTASASEIYEKMLENTPFTLVTADSEGARKAQEQTEGLYSFDLFRENNGIALHFLGYNDKDGKGASGLRARYSDLLGDKLFSTVTARYETDALRHSMSRLSIDSGRYTSKDGVITTIDRDLQEYVDGLADEIDSGCVLIADCGSGEILAMSSFPGYDVENLSSVLGSDKGELVNRCTMSFAPGSVFKLVVAAAALETDIYYSDFSYTCTGKIKVGGDEFSCHKHDGHGDQTLEDAFANSCNTYFIALGQSIGMECIADMCRRFGLDTACRADFLGESRNYYPDMGNKSAGYLANISFGQGDLCLSPLDLTRIYMCAHKGYLMPLSVVRGEIRDGRTVLSADERKTKVLSPDTCEKLLSMMEKCVLYGTGKEAAVEGARVFGKTATAQTGRFTEDGVELEHKWFCGLYEENGKFMAITVLCDYTDSKNVSPSEIFSLIVSHIKERNEG